jgi:hypothetical protein
LRARPLARRRRSDPRHHRHPATRRLDDRIDDLEPLRRREIGELSRAAERRQAMHAGGDEAIDERSQHIALDAAFLVDGRDEIRKHPVEIGGGRHGGSGADSGCR